MAKWTKEQEDILKSLWGKKTSSAIAAVLGCFTRNAVIGKASRLRLSQQLALATGHRPDSKICSVTHLYNEVKKRSTNLHDSKAVCQWPKGEPDEVNFTFCSHEVQQGESYCATHCTSAYKRRMR